MYGLFRFKTLFRISTARRGGAVDNLGAARVCCLRRLRTVGVPRNDQCNVAAFLPPSRVIIAISSG